MQSSSAFTRLAALIHKAGSSTCTANIHTSLFLSLARRLGVNTAPTSNSSYAAVFSRLKSSGREDENAPSWEQLLKNGVRVNPCQSPHHPAAVEGVAEPDGEELCVQVMQPWLRATVQMVTLNLAFASLRSGHWECRKPTTPSLNASGAVSAFLTSQKTVARSIMAGDKQTTCGACYVPRASHEAVCVLLLPSAHPTSRAPMEPAPLAPIFN